MDVFAYDDFRNFIRATVKANHALRGYQTRLAEAAGCQRSYLSQVLHSHVLVTPDQALGMAEFWRLDELQTEYFLDLVQLARASSSALKRRLKRRIEAAREKNTDLSRRLGAGLSKASPEIQARYYSSWFWSAIHIATCLSQLGTAEAIAQRLGLAVDLVNEVLEELQESGMVQKQNGRWKIGMRHLHLGKDSPFMVPHHTHWRQLAISRIQRHELSDLHYSGFFSLGKKDFRVIQELLLQAITQARQQVESSPDEELAVFTCDFFRV